MAHWRAGDLPRPTRDADRVRADIDRWGYGLHEGLLEEPLLSGARDRLFEQAAAELQQGFAFEDGGPTQQWGQFRDENGRIRPEAFWKFSSTAMRVRPTARPDPLRVWTGSVPFPSGPRQRALIRRAWKPSQLLHEEISR